MDTENHKLFKLARIEIPAFTQLNKLKFASNGSISKENISRNCVFSRMFSETCDTKAERFVFSRKSDIYRINIANKGDFVYFLNESGNRYVQDGKYKDFEKNNTHDDVMKQVKKNITMEKLTGRKDISITHQSFQDSNAVDLFVKNGKEEFVCAKHSDYIQIINKIYVPVIDENDKLDLIQIPYGQMLYRIINEPARNSFLNVPKGTPYALEVVDMQDDTYGMFTVFIDGDKKFEFESSTDVMTKHNKELRSVAIPKNTLRTVDFTDENTEFYMDFSGVIEDDDE